MDIIIGIIIIQHIEETVKKDGISINLIPFKIELKMYYNNLIDEWFVIL